MFEFKEKRRLVIPVLGFVGAAAFFLVCLSQNLSYPRIDAGVYFALSQEFYYTFQNQGFFEALQFAYLHRHWQPILHPLISSSFLFLTNGAVPPAIYLSLTFWFGLFLFYIAKISSSLLPARISWVPVACLTTTSWVLASGLIFNSELPILACLMATLFHLMQVEDFASRKHSIALGFWFGVSICIRPVEALLTFLIPIILVAWKAFSSKKISLRDILYPTFFGVFSLSCFLIPILKQKDLSGFPLILLISAGLVSFLAINWRAATLGFKSHFHRAASISILIPFLWFAPAAAILYNWIFAANFSDKAVIAGRRDGATVLDFLFQALNNLGLASWVLAAIALVTVKSNWKIGNVNPVIVAMGMLLLPLAGGALSFNGDVRYYYSGTAILILFSSIAAISWNKKFLKTRLILVLSLVALQLVNSLGLTFRLYEKIPLGRFQFLLGKANWEAHPDFDGPHIELLDKIKELVGSFYKPRFIILPLAPEDSLGWAADAFLLTIRSREVGYFWKFDRLSTQSGNTEVIGLPKGYDFVLVGPLKGRVAKYWGNPSLLAKEIETNPKRVKELGLAELGKIRAGTQEFLLFQNPMKMGKNDSLYHY